MGSRQGGPMKFNDHACTVYVAGGANKVEKFKSYKLLSKHWISRLNICPALLPILILHILTMYPQLYCCVDCASAYSGISSSCLNYLNDGDTDLCNTTNRCRAELDAVVNSCGTMDLVSEML